MVLVASPSITRRNFPVLLNVPSPLRWWHLLSLDAPTVATLWAWSFARCFHLILPLYSLAILALGTWAIYITDRLLDGWRTLPQAEMRERHHFYRRHWKAMTSVLPLIGGTLLWLIFTYMPISARREDTILFLVALAYFAVVHFKLTSKRRWFTKELFVGFIFAAATATPAWSRLSTHSPSFAIAVVFFAILCWLNCVGIERWESQEGATHKAFPRTTTTVLALGVLVLYSAVFMHSPAEKLFVVEALSAGLLLLIDKLQIRLSRITLRVAADLALLTPILIFPWFA